MPAPTQADQINAVDLAPDSVTDFRNSFHAELCNDGFWGVMQTTRWTCSDGETEDHDECCIDYGLSEAEARAAADRLNGVERREAA